MHLASLKIFERVCSPRGSFRVPSVVVHSVTCLFSSFGLLAATTSIPAVRREVTVEGGGDGEREWFGALFGVTVEGLPNCWSVG